MKRPKSGDPGSGLRSRAIKLPLRIIVSFTLLLVLPVAASTLDEYPESSFLRTRDLPLAIWITLAGVATSPLSFDQEGVGMAFNSDLFSVRFDGVLNNDQKYTPSEPHMFGRYFDLRDGRVVVGVGDIQATFGRITHRDEVPGPYSLFISSADNTATAVDLRFDNGSFFYGSRWIELNRQSSLYTYPVEVTDAGGTPTGDIVQMPLDRGANYKVYGFDFGRFRVGLQESVVYLYRSFYPEYFLSPLPMYFTQLVNSTSGKPWTQVANENSLMGFFVDYEWDRATAYFQFLIDDWNDTFFRWILPAEYDNPAKFGWSVGGEMEFPFGTIALYQAGATKYTFESTYANRSPYSFADYNSYPYSYTYFPVTEYLTSGSGLVPILPEDNYIGYLNGENNIALQAVFSSSAFDIDYDISAEYTISGAKSPSNPWHELDWFPGGTELLNDGRLEHRLEFTTNAVRWIGPFRIAGDVSLGGVWNELGLVEVDGAPEEAKIFRPGETNRFLWRVGLDVRYMFGFREPRDGQ